MILDLQCKSFTVQRSLLSIDENALKILNDKTRFKCYLQTNRYIVMHMSESQCLLHQVEPYTPLLTQPPVSWDCWGHWLWNFLDLF